MHVQRARALQLPSLEVRAPLHTYMYACMCSEPERTLAKKDLEWCRRNWQDVENDESGTPGAGAQPVDPPGAGAQPGAQPVDQPVDRSSTCRAPVDPHTNRLPSTSSQATAPPPGLHLGDGRGGGGCVGEARVGGSVGEATAEKSTKRSTPPQALRRERPRAAEKGSAASAASASGAAAARASAKSGVPGGAHERVMRVAAPPACTRVAGGADEGASATSVSAMLKAAATATAPAAPAAQELVVKKEKASAPAPSIGASDGALPPRSVPGERWPPCDAPLPLSGGAATGAPRARPAAAPGASAAMQAASAADAASPGSARAPAAHHDAARTLAALSSLIALRDSAGAARGLQQQQQQQQQPPPGPTLAGKELSPAPATLAPVAPVGAPQAGSKCPQENIPAHPHTSSAEGCFRRAAKEQTAAPPQLAAAGAAAAAPPPAAAPPQVAAAGAAASSLVACSHGIKVLTAAASTVPLSSASACATPSACMSANVGGSNPGGSGGGVSAAAQGSAAAREPVPGAQLGGSLGQAGALNPSVGSKRARQGCTSEAVLPEISGASSEQVAKVLVGLSDRIENKKAGGGGGSQQTQEPQGCGAGPGRRALSKDEERLRKAPRVERVGEERAISRDGDPVATRGEADVVQDISAAELQGSSKPGNAAAVGGRGSAALRHAKSAR
jgi:hypothetical protein